jgi:hypothetical protein
MFFVYFPPGAILNGYKCNVLLRKMQMNCELLIMNYEL